MDNADITLGGWAREVENVKDQGLKIRDHKSEFVEPTQKVKLTVEVKVFSDVKPDSKGYGCHISVYKIEKAQ